MDFARAPWPAKRSPMTAQRHPRPRRPALERHPRPRHQPREGIHLAAATLAALTLLVTACGTKHKDAEQIQAGATTTSTSLMVADGQLNSCGIFTTAEVKAFVGNSVSDGKDTGAGQGCFYSAPNSGTSLLINLQADDSAAKFADAKSLAQQQTSVVSDVPGVGDEAFTYAPPEGELASAEARVGTVRTRIVITGPQASVDMAKVALTSAASRIPANH
jgi:hypothetical protein